LSTCDSVLRVVYLTRPPTACFDVSDNELSGAVPADICDIPSVEKVFVDCNGAFAINQGCSCCDCEASVHGQIGSVISACAFGSSEFIKTFPAHLYEL
jgi:hypothetical protein